MTRRDFAKLATAAVTAPNLCAKPAKDLIDKTINALGGDAFRNMQYRVESGRAYSFYHEQLNGLSIAKIYTRYLPPTDPAPIRLVQRQVLGKKQDDSVYFTAKEVVEVTFRGPKQLPADRLDQFRNSTLHDIFYILRQRLNEPGIGMEAQGPDIVANQSAEKVEIWDSENRSVVVWISATTFLPIQQRFTRWDPIIKDRREEVTHYTKYRECGDGVVLPWATERERDKERIYQMYADHVTVKEPIADSMFEVPATPTPTQKR